MNNFRKPHGGGGDRGFGPAPYNAGRVARQDSGQKFDAICAQCGKPCQVPFRPNGKKPVYCSVCFGEQRQTPSNKEGFPRRDAAPAGSFRPRSDAPYGAPRTDDRGIADLKRQIDVMTSKLDNILKLLEVPHHAAQDFAKPHAGVATETVTPAFPVRTKMLTPAGKALVKKKTAKKKGPGKK